MNLLKGLDYHRVAQDGRWYFEREASTPAGLMGYGKGRGKGDISRSRGIEDRHEAQTLRNLTTSLRSGLASATERKSSVGRADQSTRLLPIFSLLDLHYVWLEGLEGGWKIIGGK